LFLEVNDKTPPCCPFNCLYIYAELITYFSCLKNKYAYQLVFLLMIRIGLHFS